MNVQLHRGIEPLTRLTGGTIVAELALNVVMSLDLTSSFVPFDLSHVTSFKAHASDANVSSRKVFFSQIVTMAAKTNENKNQ